MVADGEDRYGEVRTISVAGVATDVVLFSASAEAASTSLAVVFITGNPGAVHFFIPFLRKIWELSGQSIEVCGISNAGHSVNSATDVMFGLNEQIEHKINFLSEYYSKGRPVIVLAHSVGAFISLRAIDKLAATKLNLIRFIGLCPVISHIAKSRNAKLMMFFLRHAIVRNITTGAMGTLSQIPSPILRSLVSFGLMVDPNADAVARGHSSSSVLQIVDKRVAQNTLHLALEEMQTLQGLEPLDGVFHRLGKSVKLVYSPVDGWVPPGAAAELKERYPDCTVSVKEQPRLSHMFSLNSQAVDCMADCTWKHVQSALLELQEQSRQDLHEVQGHFRSRL